MLQLFHVLIVCLVASLNTIITLHPLPITHSPPTSPTHASKMSLHRPPHNLTPLPPLRRLDILPFIPIHLTVLYTLITNKYSWEAGWLVLIAAVATNGIVWLAGEWSVEWKRWIAYGGTSPLELRKGETQRTWRCKNDLHLVIELKKPVADIQLTQVK